MTIYRAHTCGFDNTFTNLADLRAWLLDLCERYRLHGREIRLHQGERHGDADTYASAAPARVMHFPARTA